MPERRRWVPAVNAAALVLLALLACSAPCGCGSVYLSGEALTAAEQSAMDAYQALQRVVVSNPGAPGLEPPDQPPSAGAASPTQPGAAVPQWVKPYLTENFRQWRFFVRSARKDLTWGPKLQGE